MVQLREWRAEEGAEIRQGGSQGVRNWRRVTERITWSSPEARVPSATSALQWCSGATGLRPGFLADCSQRWLGGCHGVEW